MEMFWFEVSVSEAPLYGLSERALFGMPFGTFLKGSPPSFCRQHGMNLALLDTALIK